MDAQPHTDVAVLALELLLSGQSTTQVRAVLRDRHGLMGHEAGRVVQLAQMELATPPEAIAVAETLLRDGRSVEEARPAVRERFSLDGCAARRVMDAALAEMIGDFEPGAVDAYLERATATLSDKMMLPAERRKAEAELEQVWAGYDVLLDADSTPRETINAAARLDKLLALGWRERLPVGAFDSAARGG